MDMTLWVCQGLLAAAYLISGSLKVSQSKERMLQTGQTGVRDYPLGFIRFIASSELLGAIGLVLPWATQILPVLTPVAATGLGVIMIGAAHAHSKLHEPRNVAINLVLLSLCVFVAVGRFRALVAA